jgi:hypothetical protein
MNESGLSAVLERITAEVTASPDVAARAWAQARRQSRRAMIVTVGTTGVAAALVVALVSGPLADQRSTPPVTTPTVTRTTSDSLNEPPQPLPDYSGKLSAVIQPAWQDSAIDTLPRLDNALPQKLDPFAEPVATLSEDPVNTAVAVAQRRTGTTIDIRILGEDQRWRRLDIAGLEPSFSDSTVVSLIGGSPLSPDGTQLALPQPRALIVVDLVSGSSHRFDLPPDRTPEWIGSMTTWSPDASQVLVGPAALAGHVRSFLIGTRTGSVDVVPYDAASTNFAPDGSLIEMTTGGSMLAELHKHDGTATSTVVLGVQRYAPRPAVGQAVAFSRAVRSWMGPKGAPINSDGILVVDPHDGAPIAFLPVRAPHQVENSELVGWLDDTTLLVHMFVPTSPWSSDALIAWNYRTGELATLTDPWKWTDKFEVSFAVGEL